MKSQEELFLTEPTYILLDADFEKVRESVLARIQSLSKDEFKALIYKQAQKGFEKYSQYIDDNKTFDSETYTMEEVADLFVYTSNSIVQNEN
jgi:hypothetical protein